MFRPTSSFQGASIVLSRPGKESRIHPPEPPQLPLPQPRHPDLGRRRKEDDQRKRIFQLKAPIQNRPGKHRSGRIPQGLQQTRGPNRRILLALKGRVGWQPVVVVGIMERTPQASRQRPPKSRRSGPRSSSDQYSRRAHVRPRKIRSQRQEQQGRCDPPESCAAKWSTSACASSSYGHDALVTAVICCWCSHGVSDSLLTRSRTPRTSQQATHF